MQVIPKMNRIDARSEQQRQVDEENSLLKFPKLFA